MSSPSHNDSVDFAKLVDDYYAALYRFAYSLSGQEADAWDLTQQTFNRWAEKGHTLRDPTKVKSWLFTTLYREFLKWNRQNRKVISIEDTNPATSEQSVSAEVVKRTDASSLMALLSEIDEVYRAPLSLFYLEDMTYREIAELLDIPTGTVMSRLSRGKAQLRRLLASDNESIGTERTVSAKTPGETTNGGHEQG